jgi:hypothetical protein
VVVTKESVKSKSQTILTLNGGGENELDEVEVVD